MKWHTPFLVFDLETTSCDEHAILDFGGVLLDEQLEIESEFQELVHPGETPVQDFELALTGYHREQLNRAPVWGEVAGELEQWSSRRVQNLRKIRLAAWGNYFDINVLRAQYQRHGLAYPWAGTALCVKTLALLWCALSGKRTDRLSVEKMADYLKIQPLGRYHTALVDAQVTAAIFRTVVHQLRDGHWLDGRYLQILPLDPE